MKHTQKTSDGFTLIELLVSIAVIATIIGLSLPNFLGARIRARDARRKAELGQLKTALLLYYHDYKIFPPSVLSGGTGKMNYISGCGVSGTDVCPSTCTVDFAAGGSGCDTVYMTNFPSELGTSMFYYQVNSGVDFCLKGTLENTSDSDIASSQARCATKCSLSGNDYAVCSE